MPSPRLYGRRSRGQGRKYRTALQFGLVLVCFATVGLLLMLRGRQDGGDGKQSEVVAQTKAVNPQEEVLAVRIERKDKELESTRHLLRKCDREKKKLQDLYDKLPKQQSRKQTLDPSSSSCEKFVKRDKAMSKNIKRQTEAISRLSRELLHLKFGTDEPYRARLTVGFPASMQGEREGVIDIEFASSDAMPTAVLFVLNQIDAGAWDGMAFIRNAGHVLQASSQDVNKKYHSKRFELSMQRKSIPFQEYSDEFPHEKYTLGLAGRPGGPDFYISTVDNTRNHGPGGQGSYDLPAEADSCFAKVVSGFDVVDRMHTAPHEKTSFEALIEYIEIKSFVRL